MAFRTTLKSKNPGSYSGEWTGLEADKSSTAKLLAVYNPNPDRNLLPLKSVGGIHKYRWIHIRGKNDETSVCQLLLTLQKTNSRYETWLTTYHRLSNEYDMGKTS
jgi:hypothetical protein